MDQQLTVVYEDNHLLVVLKRPNQLTQSDQTGDSDLLSEARAYIEEKYQKLQKPPRGCLNRCEPMRCTANMSVSPRAKSPSDSNSWIT